MSNLHRRTTIPLLTTSKTISNLITLQIIFFQGSCPIPVGPETNLDPAGMEEAEWRSMGAATECGEVRR